MGRVKEALENVNYIMCYTCGEITEHIDGKCMEEDDLDDLKWKNERRVNEAMRRIIPIDF